MQYNQGFQDQYNRGCGSWGQHKGHGSKGKWAEMWQNRMARFNQPPINIEETDQEYVILLYAAGLDKSNVSLTIKDDVLRVTYPGTNADGGGEQTQGKFTYQEYNVGQRGFERKFQLNNKVLVEGITASYADGILKITLPKNPATTVPAQTIQVA